jgi:hypothetical protein
MEDHQPSFQRIHFPPAYCIHPYPTHVPMSSNNASNTQNTGTGCWDPGHTNPSRRTDRKNHDQTFNYKKVRE